MLKILSKRFIAVTAAAMMVASLSLSAFAATTDPNMTVYNTNYTTTIDAATGGTATLKVASADSTYTATGFDSRPDARNTTWEVVSGSAASVVLSSSKGAEEILDADGNGTDLWVATRTVTVDANATPGAASIKITNPNSDPADAYINLTVVADGTASDKSNVICRFYNQTAESSTLLLEKTGLTVGDAFDGNTSYPSALDSAKVVDDDAANPLTTNIVNSYGTYYLKDATVNGTAYNEVQDWDNYDLGYGWQYRVYKQSASNANTYELVPLSEAVGSDEMALDNNYMVVYKYGQNGIVSFDSTMTAQ